MTLSCCINPHASPCHEASLYTINLSPQIDKERIGVDINIVFNFPKLLSYLLLQPYFVPLCVGRVREVEILAKPSTTRQQYSASMRKLLISVTFVDCGQLLIALFFFLDPSIHDLGCYMSQKYIVLKPKFEFLQLSKKFLILQNMQHLSQVFVVLGIILEIYQDVFNKDHHESIQKMA